MQYGVCTLSAIPMRKESDDTAEMVNQVVFGETFEILEHTKKWSFIKLAHDGYEGWIDSKQLLPISQKFYEQANSQVPFTSQELIEIISEEKTAEFYPIFLGSILPFYSNGTVQIQDKEYRFNGAVAQSQKSREELVEHAYQYMHTPYLWGGRTPFGIDCSGFTQMVYRLCGYSLPRDAYQQATEGDTLSFIEESEPGDLAFFDNEEGRITHVGIILNDNYILHASGKVRLDRLDQTGIFNRETGSHTHKLRVIKKII
ncbi:C40 family peptidase [Owenweeksia hongkongensis]|uniref:Cell wall-associated hydrolase, invasion-associated protein n=1 Tax=Owenweeksia hongkongensis (strain DSM 17368 / CIP 108786 / JCM 12287 / NRRL B-23963 / UST20020801) TaxID=926562 RepID=G8R4J7_OWEHD|nr:C40 family peptidase [Owenweeksia hongkongensis]AEV32086.1 cell wall-associated hydrolase, invasion-associated protein [Owenweeksia hongkongensis DSM 17368]